ncbi:polynucleotide adenylyltransferase PcnB [Aquabacterium sp. CECT 9606]|uniref:polynucleotide adenylyltransferase PcnB n=1 Tax=Aquabacterium sp. CECT 9606 TaxID=2845822 RepID=UPI001E631209|nr:polynucleotide adenylyltransferase PcnB [Aquabacterium sp. CECT 9606]CAH0352999.1 Poly(A) polymerase I [Aquabacterium sp. CECT 9606]
MIKRLIDKILGKDPSKPPRATAAGRKPRIPTGKRVEVPASEHGIDPSLVDDRAVKVCTTLQEAGFEAYIVGGAVRDLLVGLRPKDFDVATNATPEQVKGLFRRAFIIGRRFRIVHVVFGRGRDNEVIEVSTFRAYLDADAAEQVAGNEKTSRSELAGKSHVVDGSGRVLRDNVWGPQDQDSARRDFTVNAMYYDPSTGVVVDYHGGIKDIKKKVLRMIGVPDVRYREDPVRIIRVVRFAAKLNFEIEAKTREPLLAMSELLANVPQSRLFDEMIKLLQTGHAQASLDQLRKLGLDRGVFPILDAVFDEARRHPGREQFVKLALNDTDRRVSEGKPVAPSFLLACLLWHDVLDHWKRNLAKGEPAFPALQAATDAVFDARIGDISGRGKLASDMREIWTMQPRFDKRVGSGPLTLVEQPRFRAGFDFLRLRAQSGEADQELATWWEDFSLADNDERRELMDVARQQESAKRAAQGPRTGNRSSANAHASSAASDEGFASDAGPGPAAKKRRRRRRKPSEGEGGSAVDSAPSNDGG